MTTRRRRTEQLEATLTPQEAVLRWLAEAHAFPTLAAYTTALKGQPPGMYPLYRLPEEMEAAVRIAAKGRRHREEEIWPEVRKAVRDAGFLFYLVTQTNALVLRERRANWLAHQLVLQGLRAFIAGHEPWEGVPQRRWSLAAESLVHEVVSLNGAIQDLATRYFRGQTPLFPTTAEDLAQLVRATSEVSASYQRCLAAGLLGAAPARRGKRTAAPAPDGPAAAPPLDLETVRAAAALAAGDRAQELIVLAQAEALDLIGERDRGLNLVEAQLL